ncbi:MAG: hypothetical protein RBT47_01735 [Anaerolineae bacterium]|jgi:hypothetical protein|nr:hypothetical protein [Anaerolineae bacterium]
MQKWQHCKLHGNRITFLGAAGVFDNKADAYLTERTAFGKLEDTGWKLVSVLPDSEDGFVYFFRRPAPEE